MSQTPTIAIIPGTGNIGYGLAWRFAKTGYNVLLGSRDADKAQEAANKILAEFPNAHVQAGKNEELNIASADFVVWCLQGSIQTGLSYLKKFDFNGKIVIDTTNIFYKVDDPTTIIGKTSSTEKNAEVMPGARWVAAIKFVYAAYLLKDIPDVPAKIFSDDTEALEKVKALFESTQFPVSVTGPLVGARKDEEDLAQWCISNVPSDSPMWKTFRD